MTSVLSIVGARPQVVKAGVVSKALKHVGIPETLVHTGQHHDDGMVGHLYRLFELRPDVDLNVRGGSHSDMTGRMLIALEPVLHEAQPKAVLLYGDTNSTIAGALCAAKMHIPVIHVEAGLRSYNRHMPEEINRIVTDHLSDLLLCPTSAAMEHLRHEGLGDRSHWVGDVMYDVALSVRGRAIAESGFLERTRSTPGDYVLLTLHRAENVDEPDRLRTLLDFVRDDAAGKQIVFPVHPRTLQSVQRHGIGLESMVVTEPLHFIDMVSAVMNAAEVYTDSGGLQKEAYFHGVPCTTLREETEWVETVESGWNRLWRYSRSATRTDIAEYGEGHAADLVVRHVSELIGFRCA